MENQVEILSQINALLDLSYHLDREDIMDNLGHLRECQAREHGSEAKPATDVKVDRNQDICRLYMHKIGEEKHSFIEVVQKATRIASRYNAFLTKEQQDDGWIVNIFCWYDVLDGLTIRVCYNMLT